MDIHQQEININCLTVSQMLQQQQISQHLVIVDRIQLTQ